MRTEHRERRQRKHERHKIKEHGDKTKENREKISDKREKAKEQEQSESKGEREIAREKGNERVLQTIVLLFKLFNLPPNFTGLVFERWVGWFFPSWKLWASFSPKKAPGTRGDLGPGRPGQRDGGYGLHGGRRGFAAAAVQGERGSLQAKNEIGSKPKIRESTDRVVLLQNGWFCYRQGGLAGVFPLIQKGYPEK